jgi:hypothetical protein
MEIVAVKKHFTGPDGERVYGWGIMPVIEALRLAEPKLRCPECNGAVRLHKAAEDGSAPAHADHRKRNPGCSLGDCFDGKKKMALVCEQ